MVAFADFSSRIWVSLKAAVSFLIRTSGKFGQKLVGLFQSKKIGEFWRRIMLISPNTKNSSSIQNKVMFLLRLIAVAGTYPYYYSYCCFLLSKATNRRGIPPTKIIASKIMQLSLIKRTIGNQISFSELGNLPKRWILLNLRILISLLLYFLILSIL